MVSKRAWLQAELFYADLMGLPAPLLPGSARPLRRLPALPYEQNPPAPAVLPPPTPIHPVPRGLNLVPHAHLRQTCADGQAFRADAAATPMSSATMNPGFLKADDLIEFDTRLDGKLIDLIVGNADYRTMVSAESVRRRWPSQGDKLRVALVDLTGSKLCRPGYAGWGSTWPMPGGSTAKIAMVYAAHQLLFDLDELARVGGLRTAADLKTAARAAWSGLTCPPDLDWLVQLDASSAPVRATASANLQRHLREMVDASFSGVSTSRASELIMRIGFEYLASVLWQSGLRHPTRNGLWVGNTFMNVSITARAQAACHSGNNPITWSKNPLGATGITLTGLSAATYFTLLAQRRLVNDAGSRQIETLLASGCRFISLSGATIRASKCGLTSSVRHDAALIENGTRRYVVVVLTKDATWSTAVRARFLDDLDTLIRNNNP